MDNFQSDISRRQFVVAAAGTLLSAEVVLAQPRALTAQQVLDRIRASVGVPWQATTVDGIKAGIPDTTVTGVAVTTMATLDVLRRAAAAGRNLVVTFEPTFYNNADDPGEARASDPVVAAKRVFIETNRLVVLRFTDHWRARRPDPMAAAFAQALGWSSAADPSAAGVYTISSTPLSSVVRHVRERLGSRGGLRVVGKPDTPIRRVFLTPGVTNSVDAVKSLAAADLLLVGEARDWEAVEYAYDSVEAGRNKAIVLTGRIVSEEPGVRACADWLRTLLPEVPVEALPISPAQDLYWRPAV